jgi:hypothetical protein
MFDVNPSKRDATSVGHVDDGLSCKGEDQRVCSSGRRYQEEIQLLFTRANDDILPWGVEVRDAVVDTKPSTGPGVSFVSREGGPLHTDGTALH